MKYMKPSRSGPGRVTSNPYAHAFDNPDDDEDYDPDLGFSRTDTKAYEGQRLGDLRVDPDVYEQRRARQEAAKEAVARKKTVPKGWTPL